MLSSFFNDLRYALRAFSPWPRIYRLEVHP
jgi:hypothetical protein